MRGWCECDTAWKQEHGGAGVSANKDPGERGGFPPVVRHPVQRNQCEVSLARSAGPGDLQGWHGWLWSVRCVC